MAVNQLVFEEGTEITVDTEVEAAAAGWALSYAAVSRIGKWVNAHLEVAWLAAAAALICTLPADFAPGQTVTSPDGKFTVAANGQVSYTGSTAAPGNAVLDLGWLAGQVSP